LPRFCEFLTTLSNRDRDMMVAGRIDRPEKRGAEMEYEIEANRKWQVASLLMTLAVVGGGILYALTAA
jgi:hypothetical protein